MRIRVVATDNPQQRDQHDHVANQMQIYQQNRSWRRPGCFKVSQTQQAGDQPPAWFETAGQRRQLLIEIFHEVPDLRLDSIEITAAATSATVMAAMHFFLNSTHTSSRHPAQSVLL